MQKKFITTKEIAKVFNVQPITIYRWEKQGLINSKRINPTGKKLFSTEQIQRLSEDSIPSRQEHTLPLVECNNLLIGTKAKNIKIIQEKGHCKIPNTIVINLDLFDQLVTENKIQNPFEFDWSKFRIPNKYKDQIFTKIHDTFGDRPLVVRSSATCEDSPLLSFAGQYSSFLNVKGDKNILRAIILCYKSLFSENAIIYAKINGVRLEYESMAIVIQELVPTAVAGVIFTSDPVKKDNTKMIVEYTQGLGDTVVSGHKKPTNITVDKTKKLPKNSPEYISAISEKAIKLEQVFGNPQDIEWGWDGEKVIIFQSRNITTLEKQPKEIPEQSLSNTEVIGSGTIACMGLANGRLRILNNVSDFSKIQKGDIVLMKCKFDVSLVKKIEYIGGLILTGGVLSHMAVIAREFNIPCLVEPTLSPAFIDKVTDSEIVIDANKGRILYKKGE